MSIDANFTTLSVRDAENRARLADERAAEYRKLLGHVFAYASDEIYAKVGVEVWTEVRDALATPSPVLVEPNF